MQVATKEHTFITKYPNQRLVVEPDRPVRNAQGAKIGVTKGRAIVFDGHTLSVSEDDMVSVDRGKFDEKGEPVRTPMKLVEWLRSHDLFQVDFYDRGSPPNEPKPTISEQIADISRATEPDQVEAVVELERETHNRDVVFEAALAALERITGEGGAEEKAPSTSQPFSLS